MTFFFVIGCSKNPTSNQCSGVTIVVTGTTVNATANDGSISATATGSTGFTYNLNSGAFQASGNFNNLAPGTYIVIAKDANGCTSSKTFTISFSKTYYLTQSTWKFSNATVGVTDVSAALQACQKDNIMTFVAAGTGTIDEGATKCNAGDPQTNPFTWSFLSSETILHISTILFPGGSNDFTLVSLTETQLVLSQASVGGTIVVTFIH